MDLLDEDHQKEIQSNMIEVSRHNGLCIITSRGKHSVGMRKISLDIFQKELGGSLEFEMEEPKKPVVVIAFDVESRGSSLRRNGINACGICIVSAEDGIVISKKRWHIAPMEGQVYEERCLKEFWEKYPELKEEFERDPVSPEQFAREFRDILNLYEITNEIFLLSDNPAFDAKCIDYYLDAAGMFSMQCWADGTGHRKVHDSKSYIRGGMSLGFTGPQRITTKEIYKNMQKEPPEFQGTQHMPEDDAYSIFKTMFDYVKN